VQQGRLGEAELPASIPFSSAGEEREADRATAAVLSGVAPTLGAAPRLSLARQLAAGQHDTEQIGDARRSFEDANSKLTEDQRSRIASAIIAAVAQAHTWEVAFEFFRYYSGSHEIRPMTPDEESAAKAQDRLAETPAAGSTALQSTLLDPGFDSGRLGVLLLHEFSHTGQSTNFMGSGDYQEGQSYAVEFFYAEKRHDAERMGKIRNIITAGAIVTPGQRAALTQLFTVSYGLLSELSRLAATGITSLPGGLAQGDGDVLTAEFIAHFSEPSERLTRLIDYVKATPTSFKSPFATSGP
jgi:hypothetical protein